MDASDVGVRPIAPADWEAVLAIEGASFEYPWTRADFESLLSTTSRPHEPHRLRYRDFGPHNTTAAARVLGLVATAPALPATSPPRIVGYAVLILPLDTVGRIVPAVVLNLAVEAAWRRRGVGRLLVSRAWQDGAGRAADGRRVRALVREKNLAAQLFFRALGYRVRQIVPRCPSSRRPWSRRRSWASSRRPAAADRRRPSGGPRT